MKLARGLFIGRFQPLHLGHLEAVKYILEQVDEIILGIGSAQYSHTLKNPFTAGERYTMILNSFMNAGIDQKRYHLVMIEDLNIHDIWVSHVKSRIPSFDIVFTNESLTSRLFREAGYRTRKIPFFKRNIYSASADCLRNRRLQQSRFQHLLLFLPVI